MMSRDMSVRLLVCHAPVLYRNSLTYRHILSSAFVSRIILVFGVYLSEIPTGSSPTGALNTGEYINFAFFDQYVGNDARVAEWAIITVER